MSSRLSRAEGRPTGSVDPDDTLGRDGNSASADGLGLPDAAFQALLREIASEAAAPLGPQTPQLGEVIADKYRVEEKLGQGGMGAVFRATHLISQKQVAIKWMLRTGANENARSRFVREARAAARIDHPNVVDIYDIGQDSERGLFLVMQLLRGESLGQRIARGPLRISDAIDVLLPAMRGVTAVHEAGVIHRDLKPDNIFLCEPRVGERGGSKVLDFGISAMAARPGEEEALTRDDAVLGTPAYMSPEQIENSRSVDARTDVYAFGVILYEALTGTRPFRAQSQHDLVAAILKGDKKDPRALRPEISGELAKVIQRALSRDRADRHPDVASLIVALAPHGSLSDSASDAQRFNEPPRPARRVSGVALSWVAFIALAMVAVVWWLAEHRGRIEQPPPNARVPAEQPDAEPIAVESRVVPDADAAHSRTTEPEAPPRIVAPPPPKPPPPPKRSGARRATASQGAPAPASSPAVAPPSRKGVGIRSGTISIDDL